MKKKGLLLFLVLILAFSTVLVGCGKETTNPSESGTQDEGQSEDKKESGKPKVLILLVEEILLV